MSKRDEDGSSDGDGGASGGGDIAAGGEKDGSGGGGDDARSGADDTVAADVAPDPAPVSGLLPTASGGVRGCHDRSGDAAPAVAEASPAVCSDQKEEALLGVLTWSRIEDDSSGIEDDSPGLGARSNDEISFVVGDGGGSANARVWLPSPILGPSSNVATSNADESASPHANAVQSCFRVEPIEVEPKDETRSEPRSRVGLAAAARRPQVEGRYLRYGRGERLPNTHSGAPQ